MSQPIVDTHLDVITTVTEDGSAIDLSAGVTTQEHIYRKPDGSLLTKTTGFVSDGSDGDIHYELTDAEHNQFGKWQVEYHVVQSGKVIRSSAPATWVTAKRLYDGDDAWRVARQTGGTFLLRAYETEAAVTYYVAAEDEDGNEYDLSGRTLRLRIEDVDGTDLQTVEDADITVSDPRWSFDLDAAVTAAAAIEGNKHRWALFDVTGGKIEVLQWGRFEVQSAPVSG